MDPTTYTKPTESQSKPDPKPAQSPNTQPEGTPQTKLKTVKLGGQQGKQVMDKIWESGKSHVLGGLDNISGTVRKVSDELRHSENKELAQYTEVLAEKTDKLHEYFQHKEVGALLRDGERFARKNPEIFLAGAFILGFIGARFLKSHPESESQYI